MRPPTEPDIHGLFNELTRRHTHREPIEVKHGDTTWTTHHRTDVPSLVHQLLGAMPAGSEGQAGATPNSRPAARIEALDTIMLIDSEAGDWIDRLGEVIPSDTIDPRTQRTIRGSGTIARLRRLHGLHQAAPSCEKPHGHRDDNGTWCCDRHHLEHDVRRWWHQARIITGWDTPAYRPFNTCPVCEHRKGLRINLAMQAAFCVECRTVWDPTQIGLLGEHIRAENAEETLDA